MRGKVLYIEDSPVNIYIIKRMLKTMDYEIIEAFNGERGVQMAAQEKPDLVLLDLMLPDLDGLEVLRRIRQQRGLSEVPIVALTSHVSQEMRSEALAAGCDGFLEKPVSQSRMLKTLQQFIPLQA